MTNNWAHRLSLLLLLCPFVIKTQPLENTLLQIADDAGFFNDALADINFVGKQLVSFLKGNTCWDGVILDLDVVTDSQQQTISIYFKDTALIYGASYVTISYNHPEAVKYVSQEQMPLYLESISNRTFDDLFSGSHVIHPFTKEEMPVFISNYHNELYEVRANGAYLGVPAHNHQDFLFAKTYNLPIILIAQPTEDQISRNFRRPSISYRGILESPYIVQYDECYILKTPVTPHDGASYFKGKEAGQLIEKALIDNKQAKRHSEKLYYYYSKKKESLPNLLKIEALLEKKKSSFSPTVYKLKKAELNRVLEHAHADFLSLVESFLENIRGTKQLMIPLIEEFAEKRNKGNSYLLKWTVNESNESERVRFKRDIVRFIDLAHFCSDLVQFLSDLSNSCPNAQAYLKSLQNEQ